MRFLDTNRSEVINTDLARLLIALNFKSSWYSLIESSGSYRLYPGNSTCLRLSLIPLKLGISPLEVVISPLKVGVFILMLKIRKSQKKTDCLLNLVTMSILQFLILEKG